MTPAHAGKYHADDVLNVALKDRKRSNVSGIIERSWMRCVNEYGLDPATNLGAHILTATELHTHQENIEVFLRVAKSGLSQLYTRVSDLGYVLLLTNHNGITVDYLGHGSQDKELKAAGLYLGADWNESRAGTNGVGVCLAERQALICHQDEHFGTAHIALTCTAAPIFDPAGDLLAILDASALQSPKEKDSQYLLLQLVTMHARMIECANFLYHFKNYWIIRFGEDGEFVNISAESMLAFDSDGVIVGANQSARNVLASDCFDRDTDGSFINSAISDVFNCSVYELIKAGNESSNIVRPLRTTKSDSLYFASIKCPLNNIIKPGQSSYENNDPDGSLLYRLGADDDKIQQTIKRATRLVDRNINILIRGETGSGKEVLAKVLHESSSRSSKPFIAVNCAAIPESLIESELFGYKPGTFTGARAKGMPGLITQSSGGTLFLDEIGDMPLHLQCRLLRVLSENEVLPLGAEKPVPVDLHVISATHCDLQDMVARNKFREDLYHRLNGTTLDLPSLRVRTDKEYLIHRILEEESAAFEIQASLSEEAMAILLVHQWPGNIRELRNAIRYALAIVDSNMIEPEHLPDDISMLTPHSNEVFPETAPIDKQDYEQSVPQSAKAKLLLVKLKEHKWNITNVALDLDICRATVYRRMKHYGIIPPNQM